MPHPRLPEFQIRGGAAPADKTDAILTVLRHHEVFSASRIAAPVATTAVPLGRVLFQFIEHLESAYVKVMFTCHAYCLSFFFRSPLLAWYPSLQWTNL